MVSVPLAGVVLNWRNENNKSVISIDSQYFVISYDLERVSW